ncbi:nucleotidyltransferase domain-containing protein [Cellulomonas fimi]|nr:nucleotidyltransferase domain-containing protein [Cellulomonas fimi]
MPASFDPTVVAAVTDRLAAVEHEHGVRVAWAVESGSRAWGFPSPDSDYDCRFVFVRPVSAYLDPWPARDVVETPLDAVLDVNGWDLVKAVRLATAGNATLGEWLRSPFVYAGDPAFRDELLDLVDAVADRAAIVRHYLHVGRDHWLRSGAADGAEVALKRVFYALRPAATLHWLEVHPGRVTPPMDLHRLLAEAPVHDAVAEPVAALVAAKAVTRELGTGVVADPVRRWVQERFAAAATLDAPAPHAAAAARTEAARRFRDLVRRWAPPG